MIERQITEREIKALQIAAKSKLTRKGNVWLVPSQAGRGEYEVTHGLFEPRCTCPDYGFRQAACKHVYAVQYVIEREQTADGQSVVTETVKVTRKTYTQDWKAYNTARRMRNQKSRHCFTNCAKACQSQSNAQADRAYR
jgi:hypothetical protein